MPIITYTIDEDKAVTVDRDYSTTSGENLVTTLAVVFPDAYSVANGWTQLVRFSCTKAVTMSDLTTTTSPTVELVDGEYVVPNGLIAANPTLIQFTAEKTVDEELVRFEAQVQVFPRVHTSLTVVEGAIPPLTGVYLTSEVFATLLAAAIAAHNASGDQDARYYTRTLLDAGQLDSRYYTQDELDAGQLDGQYYTEDEVDLTFATKAELIDIQAGLIGDGTIDDAKLSNDPGQVKDVLSGITATPGADKIVKALGTGLVDPAWLPSRVACGVFVDTTTVITTGTPYTKTIPLGISGAKKGRIIFRYGAVAIPGGAIAHFTTDANDAIGYNIYDDSNYMHSKLVDDNLLLPSYSFIGTYITLYSAYIDGTNLILVFTSMLGTANTLSIGSALWEVEA